MEKNIPDPLTQIQERLEEVSQYTGGFQMSEEVEFIAIRKISRETFMDLAQDGMRELFDLEQYKVIDGSKGKRLHHFVYDTKTHDCYLIDIRVCYELLASFYAGDDKQKVLTSLNKIASFEE